MISKNIFTHSGGRISETVTLKRMVITTNLQIKNKKVCKSLIKDIFNYFHFLLQDRFAEPITIFCVFEKDDYKKIFIVLKHSNKSVRKKTLSEKLGSIYNNYEDVIIQNENLINNIAFHNMDTLTLELVDAAKNGWKYMKINDLALK